MLITTRYVGPTNTKGSRIRAQCGDVVKFYPYRSELNSDANHKAAAMRFAREVLKLAKSETWVATDSLDGWAFMRRATVEVVTVAYEF